MLLCHRTPDCRYGSAIHLPFVLLTSVIMDLATTSNADDFPTNSSRAWYIQMQNPCRPSKTYTSTKPAQTPARSHPSTSLGTPIPLHNYITPTCYPLLPPQRYQHQHHHPHPRHPSNKSPSPSPCTPPTPSTPHTQRPANAQPPPTSSTLTAIHTHHPPP